MFHLNFLRNNRINNFQLKQFFKKTLFTCDKEYYRILGVNSKSSQEEIKKAYFKLAKQWHPDINKSNNAKDMFSKISVAYDTLGDSEKRKDYDGEEVRFEENVKTSYSYNQSNFYSGNPYQESYNFYDKFNDFDDESDSEFIFENFKEFTKKRSKISKKQKDINYSLELSFMESINGCLKVIEYERLIVCSSCKGKKARIGYSSVECKSCKGTGIKINKNGSFKVESVCEECLGEGIIYKNPCLQCAGEGIIKENCREELFIPKGVEHKAVFKITKRGNIFSNRKDDIGDLIIKIQVKRDNYFRRDGFDILTTNFLSISEAVLGTNISVKTIYGYVDVKINPGTQDGEIKKILNHGVSKYSSQDDQKGNHLVRIKIKIPKKITPVQKRIFEELQKHDEDYNTN